MSPETSASRSTAASYPSFMERLLDSLRVADRDSGSGARRRSPPAPGPPARAGRLRDRLAVRRKRRCPCEVSTARGGCPRAHPGVHGLCAERLKTQAALALVADEHLVMGQHRAADVRKRALEAGQAIDRGWLIFDTDEAHRAVAAAEELAPDLERGVAIGNIHMRKRRVIWPSNQDERLSAVHAAPEFADRRRRCIHRSARRRVCS